MTGAVAEKYGTWDEKRRRANRLTVVIDGAGTIRYVRRSVPWESRPFAELVDAVRQAAAPE
jgi:peroxiredoxin